MAFDRNDDAGTGKALEDALGLIAQGEGRRAVERIAQAPATGLETEWGIGFRCYEECLANIRQAGPAAPEGGVVTPLPYTIYENTSYSVVPPQAIRPGDRRVGYG